MIARSTFFLLLCLGQAAAQSPAESPKADSTASEASLKELQQRVEATVVSITRSGTPKAMLAQKPVFRYSDELRRIEDAGIWLWTDHGRAVAAMKVERYQAARFPVPWLYCFASLSPELIRAEWADAKSYQSKQPGAKWRTLPEDPAMTRAARLVQMREAARRFSVELIQTADGTTRTQMRLLSRPLLRYDETAEVLDGAIFGFTGTGTNPDVLLLFDLPPKGVWRFGFVGMTAEGVSAKLGDSVVADIPHSAGKGNVFDNWCNFHPMK